VAPVKPQPVKNLVVALVLGLVSGCGFVLLRDYLDNTLKEQEDVEKYLKADCLSIIPKHDAAGDGVVTEAYRTLRASLLFNRERDHGNVILLTSSIPQEGKSTTAINLAKALAQSGEPTLVVDFDLRRSSVHNHLRLYREPGLSDYCSREMKLDLVMQSTKEPNLSAVTSGKLPPNPPALIGSTAVKRFLDECRERFTWIILDAPPIVSVTDPLLLAKLADMVLMVVRYNQVDRKLARRSLVALRRTDARVVGVVLNGIDPKSDSYHYYYSYYQERREPDGRSRMAAFSAFVVPSRHGVGNGLARKKAKGDKEIGGWGDTARAVSSDRNPPIHLLISSISTSPSYTPRLRIFLFRLFVGLLSQIACAFQKLRRRLGQNERGPDRFERHSRRDLGGEIRGPGVAHEARDSQEKRRSTERPDAPESPGRGGNHRQVGGEEKVGRRSAADETGSRAETLRGEDELHVFRKRLYENIDDGGETGAREMSQVVESVSQEAIDERPDPRPEPEGAEPEERRAGDGHEAGVVVRGEVLVEGEDQEARNQDREREAGVAERMQYASLVCRKRLGGGDGVSGIHEPENRLADAEPVARPKGERAGRGLGENPHPVQALEILEDQLSRLRLTDGAVPR
jgi:capsular exopolysaccharide synthesis family protein